MTGKVFTPATPVSEDDLFAGRMEQIRRVVDVVNQRGQHAVIFGERGVGKTSLANVVSSKLASPGTRILAPRINCDSTDDYSTLWKKCFSRVDLIRRIPVPGFQSTVSQGTVRASDVAGETITPDEVCRLLALLSAEALVIVIVDEFDRLMDEKVKRAFADTIKALSDHDVAATLVVVGVADTVDELISEHESVERALVQVQMPRMSRAELHEILDKGLKRLGLGITDDAKRQISLLSQGLPHYTHLLGLHSARLALDAGEQRIAAGHVHTAMAKSVEDAQQSLRNAYRKAIASSRRDNIFGRVLLACALARTDEFGYFAAADVRLPLSGIMGKRYDIPGFARHLNDFSRPDRGFVLRKTGAKHKHRFRFTNPLMQPLVIMKGMIDGRINAEHLQRIRDEPPDDHRREHEVH
jgi:Cdc6-like AAA superfamily ATPase